MPGQATGADALGDVAVHAQRSEQGGDPGTLMEVAGAASTPETPLAWLRFEPPKPDVHMELRCRIWHRAGPAAEDRLLARCHPHGAWVEWLHEGLGDTPAA